MVSTPEELYPAEFRNVIGPSRSWDSACRLLVTDSTPRVPPTTLQISVLDIEPAVWATSFKPDDAHYVASRKNTPAVRNVGEMSHAEVARRTEEAIAKNKIREAEKEERRLRLKEARENREKNPTPKKTPRVRKRPAEENVESPRKSAPRPRTAMPKMGPKSEMAKLRGTTPIKVPSPKNRRAKKASEQIRNEESYESSISHSVEEEVDKYLAMSPTKRTMISNILRPKLDEVDERRAIENSYENHVMNSLTSEVPKLLPKLLNFGAQEQNGRGKSGWTSVGSAQRFVEKTILSRVTCNNALRTLNCASNDNNADHISDNGKRQRLDSKPKPLTESGNDGSHGTAEPADVTAPFTPGFNRVTFGSTRKNGFHNAKNAKSTSDVGPVNLRRHSKDFSPQKRYAQFLKIRVFRSLK